MVVHEVKNGESASLTGLQFICTGESLVDFKRRIWAWMREHQPMTLEQFFNRLEEFSGRACRLNMVEE